MFIYVIILDRNNTVSVYQYIGHDHCREEIQQRHPFLTNDYRINPLRALSQVAMLRGICEGYCQNHRVRSSSTALANETTLSAHLKSADGRDYTSSPLMIVPNG